MVLLDVQVRITAIGQEFWFIFKGSAPGIFPESSVYLTAITQPVCVKESLGRALASELCLSRPHAVII